MYAEIEEWYHLWSFGQTAGGRSSLFRLCYLPDSRRLVNLCHLTGRALM